MRLILQKQNSEYTDRFARFIIKVICTNFREDVNFDKLKQWDIYFKDSNILGIDVNSNNISLKILCEVLNNLIVDDFDSSYHIYVNQNAVYSQNKDIKLEQLLKLITFGNSEKIGYPIVKDIFEEIADNIKDYFQLYKSFKKVPQGIEK